MTTPVQPALEAAVITVADDYTPTTEYFRIEPLA